jgi:hypothetical protein
MIVYLGAAIDTSLGSPADQFNMLSELVLKANKGSVIFFNPLTAFINAHAITREQDMQFLIDINNTALDRADLAVFSWTSSPSMGVPLEIQRCKEQKKPMVIWNRTPKKLGIYLRSGMGRNQIIVESEEDVVAAIRAWPGHPESLMELPPKPEPHLTLPLPPPTLNQEHKKTFMREYPPKINDQ